MNDKETVVLLKNQSPIVNFKRFTIPLIRRIYPQLTMIWDKDNTQVHDWSKEGF
jgi:hypothetical protein